MPRWVNGAQWAWRRLRRRPLTSSPAPPTTSALPMRVNSVLLAAPVLGSAPVGDGRRGTPVVVRPTLGEPGWIDTVVVGCALVGRTVVVVLGWVVDVVVGCVVVVVGLSVVDVVVGCVVVVVGFTVVVVLGCVVDVVVGCVVVVVGFTVVVVLGWVVDVVVGCVVVVVGFTVVVVLA